jgi:hypothetical protein
VVGALSLAFVVHRARAGQPLDEGIAGAIATKALRLFILPLLSTTGAAWATRLVLRFIPEKKEEAA